MDIINLIKQQTPEERQALFNEFIKLLNQKREYVDIPERIVCSACQVFVDERDGTLENGDYIIHEVYGLRHYDPFMRRQIAHQKIGQRIIFFNEEWEEVDIGTVQRIEVQPDSDDVFSQYFKYAVIVDRCGEYIGVATRWQPLQEPPKDE